MSAFYIHNPKSKHSPRATYTVCVPRENNRPGQAPYHIVATVYDRKRAEAMCRERNAA